MYMQPLNRSSSGEVDNPVSGGFTFSHSLREACWCAIHELTAPRGFPVVVLTSAPQITLAKFRPLTFSKAPRIRLYERSAIVSSSSSSKISSSMLVFCRNSDRLLTERLTPQVQEVAINRLGACADVLKLWRANNGQQTKIYSFLLLLLVWETLWDRGKMAPISQTKFSNAFSWMKIYEFR